MAEQGRVIVEEGAWNDAFFAEAEAFEGKRGKSKKDQIDAVSLAVQCLLTGIVEYAYAPAKADPRRHESRDIRTGEGWRSRGGAL